MAVICQSCLARNGDDESNCSLCGTALAVEPTTRAREVTATDPAVPSAPSNEATSAFANDIRGVVVGAKLAGRYLVKEMLGRGGAAMVFRATDESLREEIALKVFPNLMRKDPGELERFKRELLVNRRISHPNVIRVHDFGTVGDDAYLTMELLGGGTLAERIENRPLPIEEAVEIAVGVSDGLHAAHQAGIVHRDVKPENILFDGAGRPKLVDFGLARLLDATTHTQGFSGTPFYMSPEQANGDEITAQTDVYSLGILLFELFTGQLPFFADSLVRIATLHLREPPPRPSSLRAGLPASLEQLILACLAKPPAERPSGAGAVAAALRKFLREGGADQVRKLDEDPSFSAPRPRPRLPQSDRTQIRAPADVQPRTSNPDDPTFDKIELRSSRETVVARVNSAPRPVPSEQGSGPRPVPTPREPGSGPRPIPTPREQGSGPRPYPRADQTAFVRDPGAPSELPIPGRGYRRSPVWLLGGIAIVLIGAVGYRLSGVVTQLAFTATPTATLVAAASPRPTTEVFVPPTPTPTRTPVATRTATPTPKPTQSVVAVRPSPTPNVVLAPSPTPTEVGFGEIKVTGIPWVSVYVDGKKWGQDVAHHAVQVRAGTHVVRVENFDKKFKAQVTVMVKNGQTCAFPEVNLTTGVKPVLLAPPGC